MARRLEANRHQLDRLAHTLLEEETLAAGEIDSLLEPGNDGGNQGWAGDQ